MRRLLVRRRDAAVWALTATLTFAILATCAPVGAAEKACECCTDQGLEIGDFTVAKIIIAPAPAPSPSPIVELTAFESLNLPAGLSRYALRHPSRLTPPGVPRYLLAVTLLI